jgi:bacterioferritin-associated ferredoxin
VNHSHYSGAVIVCVCHRVSDRAIAAAVEDGCRTFEQLQLELGVATRCGACRTCARETFERHAGGGCALRGVSVHATTAGPVAAAA